MSQFRLRKKTPLELEQTDLLPEASSSSSSPKVEPKLGEKKDDMVLPTVAPKCHAFLQAFTKKPTAKSTHGGSGNYAVIGRGFAATVNLATLRSEWGRKRVHESGKGRNLVVIGYPDPWATYVQHNMNQEFELLTLPGYSARPDWSDWHATPRWLDSRTFSSINATELARHLGEPDSEADSRTSFFKQHIEINAGVMHIEKVESSTRPGFFRYRLHFNEEGNSSIIASKVDVCTGTGQQTFVERLEPNKVCRAPIDIPDELWHEYMNPQDRRTLPRLWSAEMYVAGDQQFMPGGSVLITSAASPAGIQAGEHALGLDKQGLLDKGPKAAELVMVGSAKMNDGFTPIGRLDAMARTADGPLRTRLETNPGDALYPTDERVWFGEHYRVTSVEVLSNKHINEYLRADGSKPLTRADKGKLFVTFSGGAGLRPGAPIDQPVKEAEPKLEFGVFDQVVFNTGRNRGGRGSHKDDAVKEPGSAMELVWSFKDSLTAIRWEDSYDFPVGLQTPDKRLRILGAAGINNPVYKGEAGANNFREAYHESLPWQARVAWEGVTLAGVTIAIANGYWDGAYNPNLNTATLGDLTKMLGGPAAKAVHAMRHMRVRPLTSKAEATLASAFWSCYFKRTVPTSSIASTKWRQGGEFAEEVQRFPMLVHEINDHRALQDWWEKRARPHMDESGGPPFVESALDNALLRYADHIKDPNSRTKIKIEGP